MEASHKTHRPHIKVGKDEEEEDWNMVRKFGHGPGSLSSRSTFAALSMTENQFAKCAENFCTAASDQNKKSRDHRQRATLIGWR